MPTVALGAYALPKATNPHRHYRFGKDYSASPNRYHAKQYSPKFPANMRMGIGLGARQMLNEKSNIGQLVCIRTAHQRCQIKWVLSIKQTRYVWLNHNVRILCTAAALGSLGITPCNMMCKHF